MANVTGTNTENKAMTTREFYTAVINANVAEDVTKFAENALAKLDEKNAKRKAEGSKTAKENVAIKANLVAAMEKGVTYTAAELFALGVEGVTSTQKASALIRQVVKTGEAVESEIKIKGKGKVKGYTLVTSEDDETVEE
jgi:hypothetical protein